MLPAGEHNNDRLALLGDRVLDLVVLQQGMRHLPDANKFGAARQHLLIPLTQMTSGQERFGSLCTEAASLLRQLMQKPAPIQSHQTCASQDMLLCFPHTCGHLMRQHSTWNVDRSEQPRTLSCMQSCRASRSRASAGRRAHCTPGASVSARSWPCRYRPDLPQSATSP